MSNNTIPKKEFIPATYTVTCTLKAATFRALHNCADIHKISKTKLATRLLENAIFKEAQSHNPAIERDKK